jgi:hypothetical protein
MVIGMICTPITQVGTRFIVVDSSYLPITPPIPIFRHGCSHMAIEEVKGIENGYRDDWPDIP